MWLWAAGGYMSRNKDLCSTPTIGTCEPSLLPGKVTEPCEGLGISGSLQHFGRYGVPQPPKQGVHFIQGSARQTTFTKDLQLLTETVPYFFQPTMFTSSPFMLMFFPGPLRSTFFPFSQVIPPLHNISQAHYSIPSSYE